MVSKSCTKNDISEYKLAVAWRKMASLNSSSLDAEEGVDSDEANTLKRAPFTRNTLFPHTISSSTTTMEGVWLYRLVGFA